MYGLTSDPHCLHTTNRSGPDDIVISFYVPPSRVSPLPARPHPCPPPPPPRPPPPGPCSAPAAGTGPPSASPHRRMVRSAGPVRSASGLGPRERPPVEYSSHESRI